MECGHQFEQARERAHDIEYAETLLTPEQRAEIIEELGFNTSHWRWVHVEHRRGK